MWVLCALPRKQNQTEINGKERALTCLGQTLETPAAWPQTLLNKFYTLHHLNKEYFMLPPSNKNKRLDSNIEEHRAKRVALSIPTVERKVARSQRISQSC